MKIFMQILPNLLAELTELCSRTCCGHLMAPRQSDIFTLTHEEMIEVQHSWLTFSHSADKRNQDIGFGKYHIKL